MNAQLIIYGASQLIAGAGADGPLKGDAMSRLNIIDNGAVAVVDGRVAAVGKSDEILAAFDADVKVDAAGRVVGPGFVDCHTHLVYAGNRLGEFELKIKGADYLEILANGGGILSTVRATRAATLDQLVEQSRPRLRKMLAHGATTVEIKTGYGLDADSELKMLDAILTLASQDKVDVIPTFLPAHAVPPEFKERADDYVELICNEMLPRAAELMNERGIEVFVDVFCERGAFDLAQSQRVLETAKSLGFSLKAHVDEFTNLGGARAAIALGATTVDHLDAISVEEIELLAASETVGVVTPTVNFNFGSKEFADARKLIDSGCAVALSTDYNPGSAPCPSLPNAMAIACRYQKLMPAEAYNAATINGAFGVGKGASAGSLDEGKEADIVIFDCADYREIAYEFGANPVAKVFKKGELVYER